MKRSHGPELAALWGKLRPLLKGLSVVLLAVLMGGCFVSRDLYLTDEAPLAQELNANPEEDGGTAPRRPDGGPTGVADGGQDRPDAAEPAKDAGLPPKPGDPKPTCAGGTAAEVEPNGTIDLARPLAVGKTCGALSLGDTDWFTMDIGKAGQLRVTFEADGDARLLIQSAAGGLALATGSGGAFNFTTEGRWNLRVVSDTGRVQAYALVRP